jgi:hypothetical protein
MASNGTDSAAGDTPNNPVASLAVALSRADAMLAASPTLTGVTINVFPGSYILTSPVSVPVFGVSIEPYRDVLAPLGTDVTLDASSLSGFAGSIAFDHVLGIGAQSTSNLSSFYSPSSLRGVTIIGGSNTTIHIDPSQTSSPTGLDPLDVIEVGLHSSTLLASGPASTAAILITNTAGMPALYRNIVSGNTISGGAIGIRISLSSTASDVLLSNQIVTTSSGIDVNTQGTANDIVRPRILGNFIRGQFNGCGICLNGGSASILSNSIAFVGGTITPTFTPGSIVYNPNTSLPLPTLVVANNILFSPGGVPEIDLTTFAPFPGIIFFASNAIENVDAGAAGPNNTLIAGSPFFSAVDLHLTAASVGLLGPGDPAFVSPGAGFLVGPTFFPTNINLDIDGDSRAHQPAGAVGAELHKGADQFVFDGLRLRYDSGAGVPTTDQANRIGAVVPDLLSGQSRVALALDVPTGAVIGMFVSGMGLAGPEFQHALVAPWGAVALDPLTASAFAFGGSSSTGPSTVRQTANYGVVFPQFLEAETYIQALILRPDGTGSFSNRLRVEFDRN